MPRVEKYTLSFKASVVRDILIRENVPKDMRARYGVSPVEVAGWMMELSARVLAASEQEEGLSLNPPGKLKAHCYLTSMLTDEERAALLCDDDLTPS